MADEKTTCHVPVLLEEVLRWLEPRPGQVVVDGTVGGAGHAVELARRVAPSGQLVALDRDPQAVRLATNRLAELPARVIQASYAELPEVLRQLGLSGVDAVLLDLGLSSDQLADPQRGFSFQSAGELDLRYDPASGEPAWRLLEHLSERKLADLIYRYGEERHSRRIARAIVQRRSRAPLRTAAELAELVAAAVPRSRQRIHPATRTFQALRIAVNRELEHLEQALRVLPECLRPGGRLAIISFHSLEDRLVKHAFRDDARLEVLTRRVVRPGPEEVARNPRARSARLRVAQRRTNSLEHRNVPEKSV